MPTFTLAELALLAARALRTRRREPRDGGRHRAARSSTPTRRASPRTACRASPQYATHLANGRADGAAQPAIVRAKRRRRAGRRALRPRVSGLRARGRRGDPPGARARRRVRRRDQQPSFRRRRVSPRAGRRRPEWSDSRSATRRRRWPSAGGTRPLFGTNPIAAVFPRARRRRRSSIDLSLSEVARGKLMVAAKEGRPIPPGWALDRDGKPTTDPQGRARRLDAADGRHQGRDAGARRRVAGDGADRRRDGLRGELVLRRRGQPAAARPGVPGHRSRMRSPAATSISSASKR